MPTKRETGKDRWKRVPKDYFKKRDFLQRLKLQLSGLAFLLAVGWWAMGVDWAGGGVTSTDRNGLRANHGVLAEVHAPWDNKCDACHQPFVPIDGRSLFSTKSGGGTSISNESCKTCHQGPEHHSSMIESEVKTCAECHRDHQGRGFSLVKLADHECTSCHAQIDGHVKPNSTLNKGRRIGSVSAFGTDHPQFEPDTALVDKSKPLEKGKAPVLSDKSHLKFNHGLHMMPGLKKNPTDSGYTVDQIPVEAERARYQGANGKPTDAVQLKCASCHVFDAADLKASINPAVSPVLLPARNIGRYFLPVTYEASCRACHVLSFDPMEKKLEAPHGLQPDQVVEFLKRNYAAKIVSEDPAILKKDFVPTTTIPGKARDEASPKKRLDDSVKAALKFVFNGAGTDPKTGDTPKSANNCAECHTVHNDANGLPASVEPTQVPQIWYTRAIFDHTAHKAVSCRECHSRSYAVAEDGKTLIADSSKTSKDVLIPGRDNCVQCHAPSKTQGFFASPSSVTTGGAPFDCTECHRYHNGDNRLQGYGALAEDAAKRLTIDQFLMGTGDKSKAPPAPQATTPAKSAKP